MDGHPDKIVAVFSDNPDAHGLQRARKRGVPAHAVSAKEAGSSDGLHRAADAWLAQQDVDFLCLAGYMRILPAWFVHTWRGRCLNIHPSLLPKYKGLDTHRRVLEAGEREHGASVHFVDEELDHGPVLAQERVPVCPDDTPESLAARVREVEHRLYPQALRMVEQDHSTARPKDIQAS